MNRGGGRQQSSRGRSPSHGGRHVNRHNNSPAAVNSDGSSSPHESGTYNSGRRFGTSSVDRATKQSNSTWTSSYQRGSNSAPHGFVSITPNIGISGLGQSVSEAQGRTQKQLPSPISMSLGHQDKVSSSSGFAESEARGSQRIQSLGGEEENSTLQLSGTPPVDVTKSRGGSSLNTPPGSHGGQVAPEVQSGKASKDSCDGGEENLDDQHRRYFYDICIKSTGKVVNLKPSVFVGNREKRCETKRQERGENIQILRSGMVLLKGYLSLVDQVKFVNICRDLGRGSGGFYQPGYRDGAMLSLKMMCLGKNWDPQTGLYGDERPVDGAKPPPIPDEFQRMVKGAIQECHDYLESHAKVRNAKVIVPSMSPNICIVNFYTKSGKLGLHQDKDESKESLHKGLPVVSFSIGDSAEFLYGDERDIDKAEKVMLESGDVLIFGGKSRHVFHGVSSITPDTCPKTLKEETSLRPGRLNLTFREY